MTFQEIRIGVVGCGAVVELLYARVLFEFGRQRWARVVALSDPASERREKLRAMFAGARGYEAVDDLLAKERLDLVVVASPPASHADHIEAALRHGCHVFCEKPLVPRAVEGDRLIAAMKKAERFVAVGMPRRFFPNFNEVARLLSDGVFGDRCRFAFREGGTMRWPAVSDSLFRRERAGGGVLLDKGSHMLDQLLMLFGAPRITACEDDSFAGGVEANVRIQLEFERSAGELQASWESPLRNGLLIEGGGVSAWLTNDDIEVYRLRRDGEPWMEIAAARAWPRTPTEGGPQMRPVSYDDCFWLQLVAMLRTIRLGEPMPVGLDAGIHVIKAIEQAYHLSRPLDAPWWTAEEKAELSLNHWNRRK